jgi:hypothetical protein
MLRIFADGQHTRLRAPWLRLSPKVGRTFGDAQQTRVRAPWLRRDEPASVERPNRNARGDDDPFVHEQAV